MANPVDNAVSTFVCDVCAGQVHLYYDAGVAPEDAIGHAGCDGTFRRVVVVRG